MARQPILDRNKNLFAYELFTQVPLADMQVKASMFQMQLQLQAKMNAWIGNRQ